MALINNRMRISRIAAALVCSAVAAAAVVKADGGTLRITRPSLQFNVCNGETVTGEVDVVLGVHPNEDGTNVNVFRQFHGTLQGNQGNKYKISSIGHHQFDNTFTFFYDVEFHNNVTAIGGGASFETTGIMRIFVDANQNPTGYTASSTGFTCG